MSVPAAKRHPCAINYPRPTIIILFITQRTTINYFPMSGYSMYTFISIIDTCSCFCTSFYHCQGQVLFISLSFIVHGKFYYAIKSDNNLCIQTGCGTCGRTLVFI